MPPNRTAPLVDAVEMLALVVVPAVVLGVVQVAVGDSGTPTTGLAIGGLFGVVLAGLRRGFRAVRTPEGVERRPRTDGDDPADGPWVRLATVEYDGRYDWLLAAVLAVVGVSGFAAIALVDADGLLAVRLLAVGLFGVVASLLVVGLRLT